VYVRVFSLAKIFLVIGKLVLHFLFSSRKDKKSFEVAAKIEVENRKKLFKFVQIGVQSRVIDVKETKSAQT
jgi:hypothetical protein